MYIYIYIYIIIFIYIYIYIYTYNCSTMTPNIKANSTIFTTSGSIFSGCCLQY